MSFSLVANGCNIIQFHLVQFGVSQTKQQSLSRTLKLRSIYDPDDKGRCNPFGLDVSLTKHHQQCNLIIYQANFSDTLNSKYFRIQLYVGHNILNHASYRKKCSKKMLFSLVQVWHTKCHLVQFSSLTHSLLLEKDEHNMQKQFQLFLSMETDADNHSYINQKLLLSCIYFFFDFWPIWTFFL